MELHLKIPVWRLDLNDFKVSFPLTSQNLGCSLYFKQICFVSAGLAKCGYEINSHQIFIIWAWESEVISFLCFP